MALSPTPSVTLQRPAADPPGVRPQAPFYMVERESSSVLLIRGEKKNHNAAYIAAVPEAGRDPGGYKPTLVLKQHDGRPG